MTPDFVCDLEITHKMSINVKGYEVLFVVNGHTMRISLHLATMSAPERRHNVKANKY